MRKVAGGMIVSSAVWLLWLFFPHQKNRVEIYCLEKARTWNLGLGVGAALQCD